MNDVAPKRRWPAIAARMLIALFLSLIALFSIDVAMSALRVEGPPYARVSHAREVAASFGLLGIAALLAAAWTTRAAFLRSK